MADKPNYRVNAVTGTYHDTQTNRDKNSTSRVGDAWVRRNQDHTLSIDLNIDSIPLHALSTGKLRIYVNHNNDEPVELVSTQSQSAANSGYQGQPPNNNGYQNQPPNNNGY